MVRDPDEHEPTGNPARPEAAGRLDKFADPFVPQKASRKHYDRLALRFECGTEAVDIDADPANQDGPFSGDNAPANKPGSIVRILKDNACTSTSEGYPACRRQPPAKHRPAHSWSPEGGAESGNRVDHGGHTCDLGRQGPVNDGLYGHVMHEIGHFPTIEPINLAKRSGLLTNACGPAAQIEFHEAQAFALDQLSSFALDTGCDHHVIALGPKRTR
jgi:hypothetical protein